MSGGSNSGSIDAHSTSIDAHPASIDESSSSFPSTVDSQLNSIRSQCQAEKEKSRKLEDKLAGYKTVVQQIPKLQGTIAQLNKRDAEKDIELANYKILLQKLDRRIDLLEGQEGKKLLQVEQSLNAQGKDNLTLGLADLNLCHQNKGTPPQSSSSPSFEIIGKPSNQSSIDKNIQSSPCHEIAAPTQSLNDGSLVDSCSSTPRNTIQYQEYKPRNTIQEANQQILSFISKTGFGKSQKITPEYAAGSHKNINNGISRGFSTNTAVSLNDSNYSVLDQLHSTPVAKTVGAPLKVFAFGNKKPIWQMEQESFIRKSDAAKAAQQSPVDNVTLSLEAEGFGKAAGQSHISGNVNFVTPEYKVGSNDARLNEWKPPPNSSLLETRDDTNQHHENASDPSAANPKNDISMKMVADSYYNLGANPDERFTRSVLTLNLNDLNTTNKSTKETPHSTTSSEDLMEFPSLHTNSPSPESDQIKRPRSPRPTYHRQDGAIGYPNDEQPNLTSQMENCLMTILNKKDSPVEMSDVLYKFAEKVKRMESKQNEYKEMITLLQSQVQRSQCLPSLGLEDENTRLRDEISMLKNEYETLLDFIGALKENSEKEGEAGWISAINSQSHTDPVRSHYPDSPLMKKIESLSVMNAKLFYANNHWHNRWEMLRQQTQEEKADLKSKVTFFETVNKSQQEKIASLEKELMHQSASMQDLIKANSSYEEQKSTLHQTIEAVNKELVYLKTEVKDLTRSKRILESELMSLKSSSKSKDSQQAGNKELQSEIGLLKQQLTIFAEDFDKEKRDRLLAENKAEKLRKELSQTKLSLETRMKKMNVQIKIVENDLRTKARQNADLVYQVDDLKLKLQQEQRKSSLALHNNYSFSQAPASYQGPVSLPYSTGLNGHMANPALGGTSNHHFANSSFAPASYPHQSSPEHLPGAWKCRHCTYVNYPNRTICDICGYTVSNSESLPIAESESGRNELQSRGIEKQLSPEKGDIVVDTE